MEKSQVLAVIFDLDGTLLDTERATRDIMENFLATYGKVPDPVKEESRLGQTYKESATATIADYGLPLTIDEFGEAIFPLYKERWPKAKALPGVNRLIRHLHKHGVPLGLASNSLRRNIDHKISYQKDWKDYFSVILGGDDVPHGKPSPDIFLEAAKRLCVDSSSCLVIEDSPVGVQAAKAAGAKVVAVPSLPSQRTRCSIADVTLHSLLDFQPEIWGLPPFEDTVQGVLPIEPLFLRGQIGDLVSSNAPDACSYESVPDQVSGFFFGWAKLETHRIAKVVVSIGWDHSSRTAQRVMSAKIIGCPDKIKETSELFLIGYIRKLKNEENLSEALKITEEEESIACDALDLPAFSQYKNGYVVA